MAGAKQHDFRAGDGIVVRSPLLPLTTLVEWGSERDVAGARQYLQRLVDVPEVSEALFVASPSLHAAVAAWRSAPEANSRVEQALVKYVARMAGRSTPFGLFSAISTGTLGRATRVELAPRSEYRRRTRLDNDYLFALASELERVPAIRERLVYRPNTSLYRIAGKLRYAAAQLVGQERLYQLVSVEPAPYLDATLARAATGATAAELAAALAGDDVTLEDAHAYISQLIDAQVLVSELGVHVTGREPIDALLARLPVGSEAHTALADARTAIAELDARGCGNPPAQYDAIAASLAVLPVKPELARLFQVDMVKPAGATLSARIAAEVAQAVAALARISPAAEHDALADFRRAFSERWGDQEVPLGDVLDDESGIGFEPLHGPGTEGSPLLAGISFPSAAGERKVAWGVGQDHLLRRLASTLASGHDELALTEPDLVAMQVATPIELPGAFATLIRIAGSDDEMARGEPTVLLDAVSGPSGARILGRFCHASAELDQLVRAHHAAEEAQHPDAVFAEVVHLNEGRVGNVLCRPVLRGHEIVYLGISGAPRDQQITIDDLRVSVRGDRVVLRSQRLGREVIPRLTTAHNFWARTLGVYRFLGALTQQGGAVKRWSWGALESAPFLPRVRVGRVILERARWNLDARDLAGITSAVRAAGKPGASPGAVGAAVAGLRAARRLPRFVALAAGDNELPIDLDNPLLAAALADELAGAPNAVIKEMFPAVDRAVVTSTEGRFANEVVLTFTRTREVRATSARPIARAVQRSFAPGGEWLYAKIYCGEASADSVLRDAIAPVVREAVTRGDASQWHFLRYGDPDPHLRVRLMGDPARLTSSVLPALERVVASHPAARKLVLDTYEREVERYGDIELIERVFWHDSEAVLGIVELLDGDDGTDARWRLALRGMDSLLAALSLSPEARARIATRARERLGAEHGADTLLWTQIGAKFAQERASLDVIFAGTADADHDLAPGFELLARRDAAIAALAAQLQQLPQLDDIAWSLAHMHANRLLHASQRAQELVLWDFLRRLHASRKARSK